MRELNKARGTTFVIVTHNDKLSAQADRIVHMQDGQIRVRSYLRSLRLLQEILRTQSSHP